MFTEDVIEKMIIDSLVKNGWEYIPAENLPRNYMDVMVEPMVRDALIRLNPEIAANPSYADEVIIKLRPLFTQAPNPNRSKHLARILGEKFPSLSYKIPDSKSCNNILLREATLSPSAVEVSNITSSLRIEFLSQ